MVLNCLLYTSGDNTAWEKAKACFDEVMPKYRLADKFSDLFVDYVQGSPEMCIRDRNTPFSVMTQMVCSSSSKICVTLPRRYLRCS